MLSPQHCWCNQTDVISYRKFFHLENHCSTPFSFSFLTDPSSFFSFPFLVSSSLVLNLHLFFIFKLSTFLLCVPLNSSFSRLFFLSYWPLPCPVSLFFSSYLFLFYLTKLLGRLHRKESLLGTLSLDRLYIQNEEEKDSFLFCLSSTCNHNFLCGYNIITLINSSFDSLNKISTFTTRMFNPIQTHINGLFITFSLVVKWLVLIWVLNFTCG